MPERLRPYTFYDSAISICSQCYVRVEGKIIFEQDRVFMLKRCRRCGVEKVLLADDIEYYRRAREVFIKPSEMPQRFNTEVKWGCPYDCGLCPDHEQHSCLTVVEITDHCNLRCPVCYADSGPDRPGYRSLSQVLSMLEAVVANEGEPDVVQISGGEPTLHPEFFAILDAAKAMPIRHLMVNTNGVKIAQDPEFAARLAEYLPGFEVYLQFDSLQPSVLKELRGADLLETHHKAIENLNAHSVSTNLVVTLQRGLNDEEVGELVDYGLSQPCVRGITFQPMQRAGRVDIDSAPNHRLTLTEVRRRISEQTAHFSADDIVPVPCHADSIAMAYAIKDGDAVTPLTGMIDPKILIEGGRNTVAFERDPELRTELFKLFSTANGPKGAAAKLKDLLCCLPKAVLPERFGYQNLFRIIIMNFMDAHDFDLRSVKKTCVHIVHPKDHRLIPFDTYNLFYRDDLEATRLAPLRRAAELGDALPTKSAVEAPPICDV